MAISGWVFLQQVKHIIYDFVFREGENSIWISSEVMGYGLYVHLKKKIKDKRLTNIWNNYVSKHYVIKLQTP